MLWVVCGARRSWQIPNQLRTSATGEPGTWASAVGPDRCHRDRVWAPGSRGQGRGSWDALALVRVLPSQEVQSGVWPSKCSREASHPALEPKAT